MYIDYTQICDIMPDPGILIWRCLGILPSITHRYQGQIIIHMTVTKRPPRLDAAAPSSFPHCPCLLGVTPSSWSSLLRCLPSYKRFANIANSQLVWLKNCLFISPQVVGFFSRSAHSLPDIFWPTCLVCVSVYVSCLCACPFSWAKVQCFCL